MPRLAERQRDFSAALLDPSRPAPHGLIGPDGKPSSRRFAVYRNNVAAGLIATLKDAFPAVCRIVGNDFFHAMARSYVFCEPPHSPILLHYGSGFPDFVGTFAAAATLPYLADVARIEQASREAYHAVEAVPLETADFTGIETDRLPYIRLRLHPSLRIVRSRLPALMIWSINVEDGKAEPVDLEAGGEDALVTRPAAEVEVRSMPPGGAEFVTALAERKSVLEATKTALDADSRFDLSVNLAALINAGTFVAWSFVGEAGHEEASAT